MCGIVGYTGTNSAIPPVIEGLTRLEYRGYDSAGISILNDKTGQFLVFKKEGKLDNLKNLLAEIKPEGTTAIGHTRWATHGKVNDINAHPHSNEYFSIVHNGIIENCFQLKSALIQEGHQFLSETDSEVFLVLLTKYFLQSNNVRSAILKVFSILQGSSAFVIMAKKDKSIYSLKKGAPLVCGEKKHAGGNHLYVSSDPYALIGHVENIYFPEDNVLAELNYTQQKILFFDLSGNPSKNYKQDKQSQDLEVAKKGNFEHFMLKEIYEQPKLIEELKSYYFNGEGKKALELIKGKKFSHIYIIGCGTAWHAGICIKDFLQSMIDTHITVELASEFRYRSPKLSPQDLCLFISQSGETADTLACAVMAKEKRVTIYAIVNVQGSSLYRISDANFLIKAGQEIGVASTKAFTLQVLTGFLFATTLADTSSIANISNSQIETEFHLLATRIEEILQRHLLIKTIAQELYQSKGFIFIGRGKYFPIALEGALKLKEIAYVHAEGYAAGELKHGPIALIDENMANVALLGPELLEKSISNVEEIKARKGIIFAIAPEGNLECQKIADYYFPLNFKGLHQFSSLYSNVVLQLFAYEIARCKGTDIDKPRNLAKSVTVE